MHATRLLWLALVLALIPSARAEGLRVEKALDGVRSVRLEISPRQKYTSEDPPEKELLTFDAGKDEVVWVRTYGKRTKITQVYSLITEKAKVVDDVVIIPLRWKSITNPQKKEYNPDKHDCGVRINRTKDGEWVVNFWAIDTAGTEINYKFVEEK